MSPNLQSALFFQVFFLDATSWHPTTSLTHPAPSLLTTLKNHGLGRRRPPCCRQNVSFISTVAKRGDTSATEAEMSSPNNLVSNGTCYGSAGNELDKSFIPCGNSAFGHVTCCGAGDVCLSHNACFGVHGTPGEYGSDLTYLAGCTDESYNDDSCPEKYGIDQPWIALTQCDDSGGDWAPCRQEGDPTTLQPGALCTCTDAASTTIAITGSTRLADIARLPQTTGGTIEFFGGNTPTNTVPTAPAQTSGDNQNTATATSRGGPSTGSNTSGGSSPSETGSGTLGGSNPTDPASDGSNNNNNDSSGDGGGGLNNGAKIGIGIGAAVGGLILIAALIALWYLRRKHQRQSANIEDGGEKPATKTFGRVPSPRASEADSNPVSEADGRAMDRPWSMRSELEGGNAASATTTGAITANQKPPPAMTTAARPGVGELDGREVVEAPPHALSPVAELPGSESWARTEGRGRM